MTYKEALAEARIMGASRCSDQAHMAGLCESTAQLLLGAVSPKLIWEGAMARGLSALELATLIHQDQDAARDLMWVTP